MGRVVRRITKAVYSQVAKPLLFLLHPDTAHQLIAGLGKKIQYIPLLKQLPRLWAYDNAKLSQELHGSTFKNPIGLSAGFDKEVELVPLMRSIGMGYMIGGSVTAKPCKGNARPWYQRLPELRSLVVHAGLPSGGAKLVKKKIAAYSASRFTDFPLSVSIAKTNGAETAKDKQGIDDYIKTLTLLRDEPNISLFEINISCPNAFGGEPFTTPDRFALLLESIGAMMIKKPVFIKMPIDLSWKEFRALLDVAVKYNVAGVTIGNLRKNRHGLDLPETTQAGGLSGAPTRELGNELIRQTYLHYGESLTIIGVGGVFTARDAYQKIRLGASLIAMITGIIFEGPQVVGDINAELVTLLEADGFTNISEAIGVDA